MPASRSGASHGQRTGAPADSSAPRPPVLPPPGPPPRPDLPGLERQVRDWWVATGAAERAAARGAGRPRWAYAEAPQVTTGLPGIHHARAWVLGDLYTRYKTMRGFDVTRSSGWSCHGLRVEVAVERELGLTGKPETEAYGIARFNARCRESADRHIDMFSAAAERIGCWPRGSPAPRTMDAAQVEAVWRSLRQFFDAGLLVREHRVGPYCPHCQTPLADREPRGARAGRAEPGRAELAGTRNVTVRLRLTTLPGQANPYLNGADLLVATSAPWTLAANSGVAVNPRAIYAVARQAGHDDRVVVAEAVFGRVLGEGWHIAARVTGADLEGATYRPALDLAGTGSQAAAHRVVTASFVAAVTGTGLLPLAPAFGTRDMAAAREHGLPVVNPIGPDGYFHPRTPLVGGVFFTDADRVLAASLADRGLIFDSREHARDEPRCRRCGSPLLRWARPAWYLRTAAGGRLASGADGAADWALSRTRYWGTPLPIWECEHAHLTCPASIAELSRLSGRDLAGLDPHRPQVDEVIIACRQCGAPARRVTDVVDDWYDSGVLSFTAAIVPPEATAVRENGSRALVIATSASQARGWNRAVLAAAALMAGGPRAGTAQRLGVVADEHGRPMSTRLGNVIEPLPLFERHGADAVRWFLTAARPATATLRVSHAAIGTVTREVLLTYWNSVAFLVTRASLASAPGTGWRPGEPGAPPPSSRPALDRWLLGELQALVGEVTDAFDSLDPAAGGRRIARFLRDVSRWYIRRCRRRLGQDPRGAGSAAALATLSASLEVLTRLMAPLAPFLTDHVWGLIRAADAPDSVHLADWPVPDSSLADALLAEQMTLARRLAGLGRSARAAAMIPARQPLARALITAGEADLPADLREELADELNVGALEFTPRSRKSPVPSSGAGLASAAQPAGWAVAGRAGLAVALDTALTPELRREGLARRAVRLIQDARARDGLAVGDPVALRWRCRNADLAAAMTEHGRAISARVLAIEYGEAADGEGDRPGAREHAHAALGLTFWLSPAAGA